MREIHPPQYTSIHQFHRQFHRQSHQTSLIPSTALLNMSAEGDRIAFPSNSSSHPDSDVDGDMDGDTGTHQ
jgi:hypothetical protein